MSGAGREGYVLQPGEGRLIDLGGFSMSVKATDDQTDGAFTAWTLERRIGRSGFGPSFIS